MVAEAEEGFHGNASKRLSCSHILPCRSARARSTPSRVQSVVRIKKQTHCHFGHNGPSCRGTPDTSNVRLALRRTTRVRSHMLRTEVTGTVVESFPGRCGPDRRGRPPSRAAARPG